VTDPTSNQHTDRRSAAAAAQVEGEKLGFETDAFVVRLVDYRDSDRIVTFLTERFGRLGALARGARRSRKRFGAALAPYHLCRASLRGRPAGQKLLHLREIAVEEHYPNLGGDMTRLALAGYFTELARETTVEGHPEPGVFRLLAAGYRILDAHPPKRCTARAFEYHLLRELGLAPRLDRCVGTDGRQDCTKSIGMILDRLHTRDTGGNDGPTERRLGLDLVHGGLLCPKCAARAPTTCSRMSVAGVEGLRWLASCDFEAATTAHDNKNDLGVTANHEIRKALGAKLHELIGHPLHSVAFIEKIRRWHSSGQSVRGKPSC
jgi:DNA repair protein RecO (recombination protein O)